jgi:hypothetical protein
MGLQACIKTCKKWALSPEVKIRSHPCNPWQAFDFNEKRETRNEKPPLSRLSGCLTNAVLLGYRVQDLVDGVLHGVAALVEPPAGDADKMTKQKRVLYTVPGDKD